MKQARYKEPLPLAVIEAAIMRSSFYTHRLYQNAASFSTKSH